VVKWRIDYPIEPMALVHMRQNGVRFPPCNVTADAGTR
jgi:hypothetical protein